MGLIGALRRVIDNELGSDFDSVEWQVEPEAEQTGRTIPSLTSEVIFYAAREAIRNAARYGRGKQTNRALHLTIAATYQNGLVLSIEDDGVGIGNPSAPPQRSGQGLALHSTMMAVIGGTLTVESTAGCYTRVVLSLPTPLPSDAASDVTSAG
jgi:signal transduction histidine kinase